MEFISLSLVLGALVVLAVFAAFVAVILRRVVPTDMTHIVQSGKKTISYGKDAPDGAVYYAWPAWLPKFGVQVKTLPLSNFAVRQDGYEAYDLLRLPFLVDIVAFFQIQESDIAAQRVDNFESLKTQLTSVLQGSVRRILATNNLEKIMESRSELGEQFTKEVNHQLEAWGVAAIKTIELMDLRDKPGSEVIANIMAKEQSRIDRESRVAVAENGRAAEMAEIDAQRAIDVQRQDADQQVGLRTAEKEKAVGIAKEKAVQEVQEQAKVTTEKKMQVEAVAKERAATIDKNVKVTQAEAERDALVLAAEAKLAETMKDAEGITAKGTAEAGAQEKLLMAPVTAQITLAKEIGENLSYQTYLITLEQVKAGQTVGVEMAQALGKADLKVISTGGSEGVLPGVAKLGDLFSPEGGTKLSGMLAGLASTSEGQALMTGMAAKFLGGEKTAA